MLAKKPLQDLSIAEAGVLLRSGALTSIALTEDALSRIASLDPVVHAFILVTEDRALADAARADQEIELGIDKGALHGIPYALKDNYCTAGIATTCHSRLLLGNIPTEDCFVEQKLRASGAVLIGKLAMHEFDLVGSSFDLPWPAARNPWNTDHITGGSSSGSAAAVAAGFVPIAMGSDTGGSIRGPAMYCGAVGLKPTSGLISRRGVFPFSHSLDHCGLLTRSVGDVALSLQVVAGFDPHDPASADIPVADFSNEIGRDLTGLKLAYPRSFFVTVEGISSELVASIDDSVQILSKQGAQVAEIELPDFELFRSCGRILMHAEAYSIHEADLEARPQDFGPHAYRRLMGGAGLLAADYLRAQRQRRELSSIINHEVLDKFDAIATAVATGPAPKAIPDAPEVAPGKTAMQAIMFNVTGNPALSLPTGFSKLGLPLGMQIAARAFAEPTLLRIGASFEAATDWKLRHPHPEASTPV